MIPFQRSVSVLFLFFFLRPASELILLFLVHNAFCVSACSVPFRSKLIIYLLLAHLLPSSDFYFFFFFLSSPATFLTVTFCIFFPLPYSVLPPPPPSSSITQNPEPRTHRSTAPSIRWLWSLLNPRRPSFSLSFLLRASTCPTTTTLLSTLLCFPLTCWDLPASSSGSASLIPRSRKQATPPRSYP